MHPLLNPLGENHLQVSQEDSESSTVGREVLENPHMKIAYLVH